MVDRVGQQLGNYRLIRLLGRGGFAEVYLGEHLHLKTWAAIKILHSQLTEEDLADFLQEAQTIAHLEHPHIVRILDFGVEGSTPFLVMSYAPNGTLRTMHPKGKLVPLDSVVANVKQVALALQYAHELKLIHRDVKPENMLVGRNNEVLVSDFGIAAVAHSTTSLRTQVYSGTIHYSAPEQIAGKPRPASDQYALGIVVYEWLSGTRPFSGDLTQLVYQHISAPPPTLRSKVPTISADVEQVVLQALAKEPERRFASVQDFATALEQACETAPTRPATLSPEKRLQRQSSLPSDGITALSSSQPSLPTNMVTPPNQSSLAIERMTPTSQSLPRTTSTTSSRTPDGLAFSPRDSVASAEPQPPSPTPSPPETPPSTIVPSGPNVLVPGNDIAIVNQHQDIPTSRGNSASRLSLPKGKTILLVGLAFFLLMASGSGLFYVIRTNQITAANSYGGRLALDDPLRDNSRGNKWEEVSNVYGTCAFVDGALHVSKAANSGGNYCAALSTDSSNFAFEAQMKIIKGDLGGLVFRLDYNNNNFYFFSLSTSGYYGLSLCPKGYCKDLVTATFSSAIHQGLNQTNIIAVVAKGSTFTLYVNQQQLTSANDSTSSHGQIALAAWQPPTNGLTEVVYSNAKVWKF